MGANPTQRTERDGRSPAEPGAASPSTWQRLALARHPDRPHTLDYVKLAFTDFTELRGDRLFGDDSAVVGGLARLEDETVMVIGHQKGRDTKENLARHFGMPKPEGYRKALRLMKQAEQFQMPVIAFIDTPGADPGIQSEERGQAQSIATNLIEMCRLRTPMVSVVIGEGGSGGAIAIGVTDRILMMENSVYSVVSPEGCAAILWKDAAQAPKAAEAMRITAQDLWDLGIVDEVIAEPAGGAQIDYQESARRVQASLVRHLAELRSRYRPEGRLQEAKLLEDRWQRFRRIGVFS